MSFEVSINGTKIEKAGSVTIGHSKGAGHVATLYKVADSDVYFVVAKGHPEDWFKIRPLPPSAEYDGRTIYLLTKDQANRWCRERIGTGIAEEHFGGLPAEKPVSTSPDSFVIDGRAFDFRECNAIGKTKRPHVATLYWIDGHYVLGAEGPASVWFADDVPPHCSRRGREMYLLEKHRARAFADEYLGSDVAINILLSDEGCPPIAAPEDDLQGGETAAKESGLNPNSHDGLPPDWLASIPPEPEHDERIVQKLKDKEGDSSTKSKSQPNAEATVKSPNDIPPFVDWDDICLNRPPAPDTIMPGFVIGTTGITTAPGATGKTFHGLQCGTVLAMWPAITKPLNMFEDEIKTGRRVLYFSAEDPMIILKGRLRSIAEALHPQQYGEEDQQYGLRLKEFINESGVKENFRVHALNGTRPDINDEDTLQRYVKIAKEFRANLICFDTFTRFHKKKENDNGEMSATISNFEYLCAETEASCLLMHHTSKIAAMNGQGDQQQSARGASVIVDNPRWGASLNKMSTEQAEQYGVEDEDRWKYVFWVTTKVNYGPESRRWFKKNHNGVLMPIDFNQNRKPAKPSNNSKHRKAVP